MKTFFILLLIIVPSVIIGIYSGDIFQKKIPGIFGLFYEAKVEAKIFLGLTPYRLIIPKIDVNTGVEIVGEDEKGRMDVPENVINVAWYKYGSVPGKKGNSVISGHLDSETGPAIFYNLIKLDINDDIFVIDELNNQHRFVVVKKAVYNAKDFPLDEVFGTTNRSRLNLITCGGKFNGTTKEYSHRVVIFSELVN